MAIFNMVGGGSWGGVIVPLNKITNLSIVEGNQQATITWTDPADITINWVNVVSWTKTILVRKVGSAPTSSTDGTVVTTSTTRSEYSSNWFVDTWVTNNTVYYYAAFAVWDNGTESISNIVQLLLTTSQILCFRAETANSTLKLVKNWSPTAINLEISYDTVNWSDYTIWNNITLQYVWAKVFMRNKSTTTTGFSTAYANRYTFSFSSWAKIWASWSLNYLINKNSTNTLVSNYCYWYLFNNTNLTTAPELPATTLTENCYISLFDSCRSLRKAPSTLPATNLAQFCYYSMFEYCTSLTTAPSTLPATTVPFGSYEFMFQYCTGLTTPPSIKATTVDYTSMYGMFISCTNLIKLPYLRATSLGSYCYKEMFKWCSKIKISTTKTWEYQTAYRIPTSWTWSWGSDQTKDMFASTGGTFTWTPSINTTYYTSNTVV